MDILLEVKKEIDHHPRLALSEDPWENIWAYYSVMCVTPIVMDDFHIVTLSIPVIDRSLEMDLYDIHNFSTFHPEIKSSVLHTY